MSLFEQLKTMNPRLRYVCPLCGERYHPGNCAIISSRNILKDQLGLPVPPDYPRLQRARRGWLARCFVTTLDGPEYAHEQAVRLCPHCDSILPDNDVENYTIAIVGDLSSGKSLFIASCIAQLLQKPAEKMIRFTQLRGLSDTNERYFENYYKPVHLDRMKQPPTQQAGMMNRYRPLIYEMSFTNHPDINLLFYDASGEDINDVANMTEYSHFILNASAIIFLADPMQMQTIVNALPNHLKPSANERNKLTSADVLERVISTFKRYNRIRGKKKIKTPIAITVSKSDLLKFVSPLDTRSALYLLENQYTNKVDTAKFGYVSKQVETLIDDYGDSRLLQLSKQFQEVCFFAVSATGWSPDANGEFPPLEPKRCLDPLLWALWKLNLIEDDDY